MLNRVAGARLPGLQAPALAAAVCALAYLPVLVLLVGDGRLAGAPLDYALAWPSETPSRSATMTSE